MAAPKIVMRGALGLHLSALQSDHVDWLKKRLTVRNRPYRNEPAQVIQSFFVRDGYFWVPRYFDWMSFWPTIQNDGWQWVAPFLDYDLQSNFTPDASRNQPQAIKAMVEHLQQHSGGIAVLPTGIGKTYLSLEIGRHFKTPMVVMIHKGDMIDNWVEHCEKHLGIPHHDVGIVKENRCDEGKPVTICSVQTLLSRDFGPGFYEQFGFMIADEIHHYGAREWSKVISAFPARYRLGVSANPIRKDGLDPIVRWNFGKVGFGVYKKDAEELPLACMVRYMPGAYRDGQYWDGEKIDGQWCLSQPNAMKYAKVLAADTERNSWLVERMIDATLKGRRFLCFSRLRDHINALHLEYEQRLAETLAAADEATRKQFGTVRAAKLWGGLKDRDRKHASTADEIFTTFGFSKEATNLPQIDTLVLATPPGDVLQTVGRLREKGAPGRKAFLLFDPYETNNYSYKKAMERRQAYASMGIEVQRLTKAV